MQTTRNGALQNYKRVRDAPDVRDPLYSSQLVEQLLLWLFLGDDLDMRVLGGLARGVRATLDVFDPFVTVVFFVDTDSGEFGWRARCGATAVG